MVADDSQWSLDRVGTENVEAMRTYLLKRPLTLQDIMFIAVTIRQH